VAKQPLQSPSKPQLHHVADEFNNLSMRLGPSRSPALSPRTGAKTNTAPQLRVGAPNQNRATMPAKPGALEFLISRLVSHSVGAFVNRCSIILFVGLLAGCAHFESRPLSPAQTAADLESRALDNPQLKSFLETNLHRALPEWPVRSWDFETLTLAAFYFHPSLDVARAQWGVAQAGVTTAGGRPNPVLSVVPGYDFRPLGAPSPWFPSISLDVPIETAGKRGYRIAEAQHLSEAARLNIASAAWQVRSNLRASLLDYTAARQRAELLQKQLQFQQQIVTLLEQRLQAGWVARTELTLPRVALARAGVDYADAQRQAAQARVRIAEALGLSVKAIDEVEFGFQLSISAEAGKELTSAEARQQALLGRADVLSALAEYAASQSALQLEIAKQYPDVHLNPGYQFDEGQQKWQLGLSAELPVLNRNQGPIAEAKARREESAARFVALQAKIIAEIDGALAARATAMEQLARQSQFTDLAREQSASAEAMFNAGAADKLELAGAQLEASASQLAYLDAQIKAQQAVAQLEEAIQRPLGAWPDLEQGRAAQTKQEKP
jgi:outer membrane protein, heavy metal efflux system